MGNCHCCLNPSDTEDFARFEDSDEYTSSSNSTSSFGTRSTSAGSNNGGSRRRRTTQSQQQGRSSRSTTTQSISRVVPVVSSERQRTNTELFRPTSSPMTPKVKDDQLKLAQRKGIISLIPTGVYDMSSKKQTECAICMIEFEVGDEVKYLPCMHIYHKDCIDDWLMRSLRCPACMEPVDAALLSSFDSYDQ